MDSTVRLSIMNILFNSPCCWFRKYAIGSKDGNRKENVRIINQDIMTFNNHILCSIVAEYLNYFR